MRLVAALLTVSLLAACADADREGGTVATQEGEVMIDDTENGAVRITSKDGRSIAIDRRGGNKAQWPDGFAPYPGATVTSDIAMGSDSGAGKIIAFTTSDQPKDVADFYRRQAEAAGFDIDMEITVDEGQMVAREKANGTGFAINASAKDGGTSASLTVGRGR